MALGRDDAIGEQSASGPIFVCTGVEAVADVARRTPAQRVEDLVFVQVWIPSQRVFNFISADLLI